MPDSSKEWTGKLFEKLTAKLKNIKLKVSYEERKTFAETVF